jgi:hypothetical protein
MIIVKHPSILHAIVATLLANFNLASDATPAGASESRSFSIEIETRWALTITLTAHEDAQRITAPTLCLRLSSASIARPLSRLEEGNTISLTETKRESAISCF